MILPIAAGRTSTTRFWKWLRNALLAVADAGVLSTRTVQIAAAGMIHTIASLLPAARIHLLFLPVGGNKPA